MDLRESEEAPFLGCEIAQPRACCEHSAKLVGRSVRALLAEAGGCAATIISGYVREIQAQIAALEAHNALDRQAIDTCLSASGKLAVAGG